ncbi:MAG: nucleotide exchange factor GrpE [Muribaculaceae bacterium]|nr:nucleotide exchange factor GrpE [Muribaculaceae bacterium]MDE6754866.1 nucleotide exchange factor GrpE [Muribaculaceae bacterium]
MGNNNFYDNKGSEQEAANMNESVNPEEQGVGIEDVAPDAETVEEAEAVEEVNTLESQVEELQKQVEKEKKEYLFLMADFDNFRKRTLKEKSEIIKNAGENVLKGLLPIMDDFERGIKASENTDDSTAIKEGMVLIYNKLKKYLAMNGVKEFDPSDDTFDTERHEAISVVPVADEAQKGKILDTVEKGYTINDKVLRHAKVVVAQ